MFFSHGTVHSKGVLILIKNDLEFELKSSKIGKDGRFIFIEAKVQEYTDCKYGGVCTKARLFGDNRC